MSVGAIEDSSHVGRVLMSAGLICTSKALRYLSCGVIRSLWRLVAVFAHRRECSAGVFSVQRSVEKGARRRPWNFRRCLTGGIQIHIRAQIAETVVCRRMSGVHGALGNLESRLC